MYPPHRELNYSRSRLPDGEAPPPYNNEPIAAGDIYFLVPPDERADARLRVLAPPTADLSSQSGAASSRLRVLAPPTANLSSQSLAAASRLRVLAPPTADLSGLSGATASRRTPAHYRSVDHDGFVMLNLPNNLMKF